MAQKINEYGEIMVIHTDGTIKWFAPIIANNSRLMNERGYAIVDAPEPIVAKVKEESIDQFQGSEQSEVSEQPEAPKRGRKSTK